MKKIFLLFVAVAGLTVLQSCQGEDGRDGVNVSTVYEVEADFLPSNNFEGVFKFSSPLYDGDQVFVFFLDGVDKGVDVWRPMPQTYYIGNYVITYNYDFTIRDFRVFIESDAANPDLIENGAWTRGQVFRAVVLNGNLGYTAKSSGDAVLPKNIEYETLVKNYNIKESDIVKLK